MLTLLTSGLIYKTKYPFHTFLGKRVDESILLEPTTSVELINICKSLKNGTGAENIPMHIIIDSFEYISAPLTQIVNLSLAKGIFPDKLKISKIVPIYKADDPELFSNYRPISLLLNFSKIFEKVMYNRLIKFANTLEILYSLQSGFRKNHSTSLALIHLINKIASSIDRDEIMIGASFWSCPKHLIALEELLLNGPKVIFRNVNSSLSINLHLPVIRL